MQEQVDGLPAGIPTRYPIARRWWRLRGRHHGVSIAVWLGDTVLAVHHSYKPGLRLPGGGLAWREGHHKAAVRELREEVGVTLDPAQLKLVASLPTSLGFVHLYEARVEAMPELVIDRREITEARFVRPRCFTKWAIRTELAYIYATHWRNGARGGKRPENASVLTAPASQQAATSVCPGRFAPQFD